MLRARVRDPRVASARALAIAAPFFVLFSACDGLDMTTTSGLPGPDAGLASPSSGIPPEPVPLVPEARDAGVPEAPDDDLPVAQTGGTPAVTPVVPTRPEPEPEPIPSSTPDAGASVDPPPAAFDCSTVPAAPLEFETLTGFTSSEDFVFDAEGNYVGVDDDGNLIRISKTGQKQLWAPSIGSTAGMGMLPDGSVVFCELVEGAIKRAYPNGSVVVVLGGLLYPNGLDIGPDGFIYVAENSAGRVRRIDPDTGEFSIVALGLQGPNGVAFSNDPRLFYVGSFEGSGVYKIELGEPGELGHASVFARPGGSRLLDPVNACPDQEEGVDCESPYYIHGRCEALANVVDCMPVDPCPTLADGEYCDYPMPGRVCQSGRCEAIPNPCDGLNEGDACEDPYIGAGECASSSGVLYCSTPNPCEELHEGDACEDLFFGSGSCLRYEDELYCQPPDPCAGRAAGDACVDPYSTFSTDSTCVDYEGQLYCTPPNVCDGLADGDPCDDGYTVDGTCQSYDGTLYCSSPNVCDGLAQGDACPDDYFPDATCQEYGGNLFCSAPNVCNGLAEGDPCDDPNSGTGTCVEGYCSAPPSGGGIDGMGVDACGNVYASEYIYGNLWRISPAGDMELAASLPSAWIPNIKWGRGVGGFSKDVMYVADREGSGLFGVSVGVVGATEFYATVPR